MDWSTMTAHCIFKKKKKKNLSVFCLNKSTQQKKTHMQAVGTAHFPRCHAHSPICRGDVGEVRLICTRYLVLGGGRAN